MIAQDVMTENPTTVAANSSVADAAELLQTLDIRHLPVLEGTTLVGIVSDRDLRSVYLPRLVDDDALQGIKARYQSPITTLMSPDVVRTHPEATLRELIELMLEQRVGAIPVVDPSTEELVGIVSYVDVLRAAHSELSDD